MSPRETILRKQTTFFMGLVVLILVAFGFSCTAGDSGITTEPYETLSSQFSAPSLTSPLATVVSSPIQADVAPTPFPTSVSKGPSLPPMVGVPYSPLLPAPTLTLPVSEAAQNADLQLSILHSNDTWGYLLPCG